MTLILENAALVAAVRELPAPVLGRLIDDVGLADASELVALASTEQLAHVFDEDLWRAEQAGEEPRFDAKRFALWLEILLEAGERAVVERLCELPFDFVCLCVQRLLLVIDIEALAVEMSDGGEQLDALEKALDGNLYEEWEEYRLIARDASAWDALLTSLLALDREHHALLRRILDRCADLSAEYIDDNGGLYEVLSSDEMLEVDARAERDDRRAAVGYVAAGDARGFLELARRGQGSDAERDPLTRAYFRELAPQDVAAARAEPSANVTSLLALLERAGVVEAAGPAAARASQRLPARGKRARTELVPTGRALDRALGELRELRPGLYAERLEELGYLANVLLAAPARDGLRLRPVEALEQATATCEVGLARALAGSRQNARAVLEKLHLDQLFRIGARERPEPKPGVEPAVSRKGARR